MTLIYSCLIRLVYIILYAHIGIINNNIVMLTWNNEKPFTYTLDWKSKQFYLLPQTPSQKINVQQSTYSLTAIKCGVYKLSELTVNNIIVDQHCCIILTNHILRYFLATWLSGNSVHRID